MSVFVRQNSQECHFSTSESWVILSPIEQSIKQKIEAAGTPLKDWGINIYRGILTGYNEAFIIDGKKKDELIAEDPKSAEIIRPILRGRDIKRYSCEFADLYIITTFPSLKIDIEQYQAIKLHLLGFGYDRLKQTGDLGARKKTNNQWFETQDTISYSDDFYRHKIIYPEMTKFLNFYYDNKNFLVNNKCFILSGEKIYFLIAFLNSSLFKFVFKDDFPELLGGTRELRKVFLEQIRVKTVSEEINTNFKDLVLKCQNNYENKLPSKDLEIIIDNLIFNLYGLSEVEKEMIGFIEIL